MSEQVQIGPYQILSKLGDGGMASVYHAVDTSKTQGTVERDVALKILLPQYYNDEAFLRRFAKEGLNARRLNHPNIVKTYAAGHDDGFHFIAMEFINGATLEQQMAGSGPLTVANAVSLLSPIGDALDYAHELGYVHRDMKLNNIMRSNEGRCWLTDFGVSKHLSTDLSMMTGMGQSIGTPSYMSPEQAKGEKVTDGKSDIYSLGIIAYRLLTGQLPFVARDAFELTHKIIFYEPVDPRQINPALDAVVSKALTHALAKNPADRPTTCRAFVSALSGEIEPKPARPFTLFATKIFTFGHSKQTAKSAKHGRVRDGLTNGSSANERVYVKEQTAPAYAASLHGSPAHVSPTSSDRPPRQTFSQHEPLHRSPRTMDTQPATAKQEHSYEQSNLEQSNRDQITEWQTQPEAINPAHIHAQRTPGYAEITQPGIKVPHDVQISHEPIFSNPPVSPNERRTARNASPIGSMDGPTDVELTKPVTLRMDDEEVPIQLKSTSAQPNVPSNFVPGEPLTGQPPRRRQKRTTTVLTRRMKPNGRNRRQSGPPVQPSRPLGKTSSINGAKHSTGHGGSRNGFQHEWMSQHPNVDNWFGERASTQSADNRFGTILEEVITRLYCIFEPLSRTFRKDFNLDSAPKDHSDREHN